MSEPIKYILVLGSINFKMAANQLMMVHWMAEPTNENISKSRNLKRFNVRLEIREMADELNLSFYAVQSTLVE